MDNDLQPGTDAQNLTSKSNKCKGCGANLFFDTKKLCLHCEHCGSDYQVNIINYKEKKDFDPSSLKREEIEKKVVLARCQSCGANVTIDTSNMSNICPYCSSPKINFVKSQEYQPDAIVPFDITKDEVAAIFKKWAKKRKFVPDAFKNVDSLENFKSYYVPSWIFDAKTRTEYDAELGYNETRYYTDRNGNRQTKTVTVYRHAHGVRGDTFNDLTVFSGNKMPGVSFNKIAPFNLDRIKVFTDDFLAGYDATQYTQDIKMGFDRANSEIESEIKHNIVRAHHADTYRYINLNKEYLVSKYAYTFLPVWIAQYRYNNKDYDVYINGTTGKTTGRVPRSPIKIALFVIFIVALVCVLAYFMHKGSAKFID